jgi:hypothetical protein
LAEYFLAIIAAKEEGEAVEVCAKGQGPQPGRPDEPEQ